MIETIGVVGGGQLGRMLTEAATPLGFEVVVVDPAEQCPAAQVGAEQIQAPLNNEAAIRELAERTDVLTWEIEHIPAPYLMALAQEGFNVQPSPATLAEIQDKFLQKEMLRRAGIPIAPYIVIEDALKLGVTPFIVKARTGGYDGRGNMRVDTLTSTTRKAIEEMQQSQGPVYAERIVKFDKEIAVIAARDTVGRVALYPVVETVHSDNICNEVFAPANIPTHTEEAAKKIARATMELLDGAGVFAIEMFVAGDTVRVNEIAPRVHNSGHLTIEGMVTSQFEQHIRAITGLPLGSTDMRAPAAAMINILGTRDEPLQREGVETVLALPDTHPHYYGKSSRPARKIGHITVLGDSVEDVRAKAQQARSELTI